MTCRTASNFPFLLLTSSAIPCCFPGSWQQCCMQAHSLLLSCSDLVHSIGASSQDILTATSTWVPRVPPLLWSWCLLWTMPPLLSPSRVSAQGAEEPHCPHLRWRAAPHRLPSQNHHQHPRGLLWAPSVQHQSLSQPQQCLPGKHRVHVCHCPPGKGGVPRARLHNPLSPHP